LQATPGDAGRNKSKLQKRTVAYGFFTEDSRSGSLAILNSGQMFGTQDSASDCTGAIAAPILCQWRISELPVIKARLRRRREA